jgi:hypothetical protein
MYPPYPPDQAPQGQPQYPPGQGQQGYPSYPSGQAPQGNPYGYGYGQMQPAPAGIPKTVKAAAVLMYIGAGFELLGGIAALAGSSGNGATAVGALIGAGVWIWMALKSRAGRNWARITGTVLFGLDTIFLIAIIAKGSPLEAAGASINWVLGLVVVILLWQRSSSAHFTKPVSPGYPSNYPVQRW